MKEKYLVINAGSSSLKFSLFEYSDETLSTNIIANGNIEKIGHKDCFWTIKSNKPKIKDNRVLKNHKEALETMLEELVKYKFITNINELKGIGHRILHGGEYYKKSVIIDKSVLKNITELTKLGPLHHPREISVIKGMEQVLPNIDNVAVFDTAFHSTIPEENYIYPVPYEWYEKYGVRKYGFHGTSHKYITEVMTEKLNKENPNLIICHIGSGASLACIKDGKCFDTTMGLTPLDGLMMCTRSGAIDPSIIEYVCKESGKTVNEITSELNQHSGLYGLCDGISDLREVLEQEQNGNENTKTALKIYVNSMAKYIAQYYMELDGNVDGIIFTAGVGENCSDIRERVINKLSNTFNINIDKDLNNEVAGFKDIQTAKISTLDSKTEIWVIPTDEELMIFNDTKQLIDEKKGIQRKRV